MSPFRFGRIGVLTVLLLGSSVLVGSGCSRQAEGERCVREENNDADCDDGLVCILASSLQGGADRTDRCCHPDPGQVNDSRCVRGVPSIGGSSGGAAGAAGAAGDAGAGIGGSAGEAGSAGATSQGGSAGEGGAGGSSAGATAGGAAGDAGAAGIGNASGAAGSAGNGG